MSTAMITDIHSHNFHISSHSSGNSILSFCYKDKDSANFKNAQLISVGIHPWYINEHDIDLQIEWIKKELKEREKVVAIGECGIDRICGTPIELQEKAFQEMINISETEKLPIIIHCVKAYNEIIRYKNKTKTSIPWIIHGFRGKKEMAEQLIRHGFYISVGEKYQADIFSVIPADRLLTETDESSKDIDSIIKSVADIMQISDNKLKRIISDNTNFLFFNR